MSWICSDCGDEMRVDPLALGGGHPGIPLGWHAVCSATGRDQHGSATGWDRWVQHDPCAAAPHGGRAEWVAHQSPVGELRYLRTACDSLERDLAALRSENAQLRKALNPVKWEDLREELLALAKRQPAQPGGDE